MKRLSSLILAVLLLPVMLSGCKQSDLSGKPVIVCTVFPQYDWVLQILGEKADDMELTLLLNKKVDLHSYQPSVDDIAKISSCDLFIYVGGESDEWTQDALKSAVNENMLVINLLDTLGDSAKEEEHKEGMAHEPSDAGDAHAPELDEHVWLSLKNAQLFCEAITGALTSLDAANVEIYERNLAEYRAKLSDLDARYQAAVNTAQTKTLLFGDRFPFRYLTEDYGIDYYAAFSGCSTETEAGFDTIIFLAEKADELGLGSIVITESSDGRLAETIVNTTAGKNQQIFVLDSMQSVSDTDIAGGTTYLSVMEQNLNVLSGALN